MRDLARDLTVWIVEALGVAGAVDDTMVRKVRSRLGQNWIGIADIQRVLNQAQAGPVIKKIAKDFSQLKGILMSTEKRLPRNA